MADEKCSVYLSVWITEDQKRFLDHAKDARQSSAGAIVRAALEAYRRLHPTLEPRS